MPRFKKDTSIDGWPIVDGDTGNSLSKNELIDLLNSMSSQLKRLEDMYDEADCLMSDIYNSGMLDQDMAHRVSNLHKSQN